MRSFFPKKNTKVFEGSSGSGKDTLRIIPIGGIGNVTKNMYVYEYRYDGVVQDILLVDCGIGFPEPEMYGVDLLLPDIRYIERNRDKVRGLVFTHGHDDHIGGISYLLPRLGAIPMWAPTLAAAFANVKLKEANLKRQVTPVRFDETLRIGPFTVSFIRVTHSVPDTSHLVIKTPVGVIYHGSDFKFDMDPLDGKKSELEKITAVGRAGVLCLLTDCLGSERPGFTPSEQIIGETLQKELSNCPGKLIFTTQSSNISRIARAVELAIKAGRKVAFLGRSIDKNVEAAVKLGYMRISADHVVRDRDLKRIPPQKQFLVAAGAQGQPGSALSRMANEAHMFASINEGDTVVFSADPIPGNEHAVGALIDEIYRLGARVSYSDIMEDLHVSGHGSQGDLMLLLSAVGPKYILPIGGTYRHMMQYRRLAQDVGYDKKSVLIPEEGDVLEFRPDAPPRVVETLELENVMVDGLGIGDVGHIVLRDRQTIATEGIVVVILPIQKATGRVTGRPDIVSRGFVYMKGSGNLLEEAKKVIAQSLRLKKGRIIDWQYVRRHVEEDLGAYLLKKTGRRPLIVPVIVEV
jgi:ribonuclease J